MASRPPLRAAAALALAIYALILIAGPALLHGFACSGHGAPHCLVCACVHSVASIAESPALLTHDRSNAGAVRADTGPAAATPPAASVLDRAPPAA